jgi:hypothetical protein
MKKIILNLGFIITLLIQQPVYACFSAWGGPGEEVSADDQIAELAGFFGKIVVASTVSVASSVGVNMFLAKLNDLNGTKRSNSRFSSDVGDVGLSIVLGPVITGISFYVVKKISKVIRKKVNEVKKKG